jgi:hypothetical protein
MQEDTKFGAQAIFLGIGALGVHFFLASIGHEFYCWFIPSWLIGVGLIVWGVFMVINK